MVFKFLDINLAKKNFATLVTDLWGPVDFAISRLEKEEAFCLGAGPLARSKIQGAGRLVICAPSPLWEGVFISSLGGAGRALAKVGANYLVLRNKAPAPVVLKIKGQQGKISCDFLELSSKEIKIAQVNIFEFERLLFKNFASEFFGNSLIFRILTIGPAALRTNFGAVASTALIGQSLAPSTSWAGRGGLGSVLAQKHNVWAIVFGGDAEDEEKIDFQKYNEIFKNKFNKTPTEAIFAATKKYRYDPDLDTGGTFGSNFTASGKFFKVLGNWFLSFNWRSCGFSDEERDLIYENLIRKHYLAQFNQEIIRPKSFTTCGDICSAVCKKIFKNKEFFKKDYEPYEAAGPNCGIFDQRAAEKVVKKLDELGFDVIEAGNMISWIMEMVDRRLIIKDDFNLKTRPKFDFKNFDVVRDSENNALLALEIIDLIIGDRQIFGGGIRSAAKKLMTRYQKPEILNCACYTPNGERGSIAPTQYWAPGVFLPLSIQGKYYEDYGPEYNPPEVLGKKSFERFVAEISLDNTGFCRFHRKWAEETVEEIIGLYLGKKIDFFSHHKALAQRIIRLNQNIAAPCFWESERVIDIIAAYLKKASKTISDTSLKNLVIAFEKDKNQAARNYWERARREFEQAAF